MVHKDYKALMGAVKVLLEHATDDDDDNTQNDITSIPLMLRGYIKKESEVDRIIAGYASIIEVDLENQLIPKETLEKGIETLLSNSEYANLMIMHQNIQIGTIIESYGDLKTHVDDNGLFIVARIRNDIKTSNKIWEMIINNELNGFSIAAEVLLDHRQCDAEKCIQVIDKINIFEVSVCSQPVNNKSGFIVISKSNEKDYFVEIENVCFKNLNNNEESNMAKSKKVIKKADDECEDCTEEKSVPEVVDTIVKSEDETPEVEVKSEDVETIEEDIPSEEPQDVEKSTKEILESLVRDIESMKGVIESLKAVPDEDEEEDEEYEEPEEEPSEPEEEWSKDKPKEPVEEKSIVEPIEENIYAEKKDFDELKKSVEDILKKFNKLDELDNLQIAIKSKDDQISALTKRLEIVEKSEDKPKTLPDTQEPEDVLNRIVKDTFRPGTFYKDVE